MPRNIAEPIMTSLLFSIPKNLDMYIIEMVLGMITILMICTTITASVNSGKISGMIIGALVTPANASPTEINTAIFLILAAPGLMHPVEAYIAL